MSGWLTLALLAILVATLYGPVSREVTVLGVWRQPVNTHQERAEGQAFYKIEDTMQCEDLHYHATSGKIYTACEDSILPRFSWFPPLGNVQGPVNSIGSFHVIDPVTKKSVRLTFENFAGPFITHGIEIIEDPVRSDAIYVFAVNHLSNAEYFQSEKIADDVPKARSQIEIFHHVQDSSTIRHVRSVYHPLIITPNDIYAESPSSFYVTNDHFYREGLMRSVEDLIPAAKWSSVIHIQLDSLQSTDPAAGLHGQVALTGLHNNNGMAHGQSSEEMLISGAISGVMYRAKPHPENHTISVLDEFRYDCSIDNPSYYTDPYRSESDDASGYVQAGLLRAIDLAKTHADPNAKDGVMVWYTRRKATTTGESPGEWETRLLFEDDGNTIRSASGAVLVPIEPNSADKQKKAWLFLVSSRSPSTSSTATTSLANDVNPPPSTRPADLNLPEPVSPSAPTGDKLKRYVALGRAYLSFYKTGLKNVYHNYRASIPLRRSLGLPAYLPSSIPPAPPRSTDHVQKSKSAAFRAAVHSLNLSRSDLQLVRRAAYDLRRMIPFTLLLIICGEMTPLVVLALGNAVTPLTCRVPSQIAKDRRQRLDRKRAALAAHHAAIHGSVSAPPSGSDDELILLAHSYTHPVWIESASADEVLRACAVLNLVKDHTRPSLLVSLVYRERLRRYAEYLDVDDGLIRRCGGVTAMEADEVHIAVEERGGVGATDGEEGWDAERDERRWLEKWLERKQH
ncbi:hypothetical protein FE257_010525 [Aspergillus nanangensis]|uniref:Letm1 RBD domain-containing protein n=1 Tax=Aspergillus nanangensis TaxID=2582783 RepID=A0AAD4CIK7_ASPNN|nr:hypothetical protein FE257_010525 [Aspergillus nanangensis]